MIILITVSMSYLDILPSDILLHIINKSTISIIENLTKVVHIDDIQFKFLYSLNFKYIYDNYAHIFDLDKSITWKDHYIQMFKLHNLFVSINEMNKIELSIFENLYIVDDSIFRKKLSIPKVVVKDLIYAKYSIADYFIIDILTLSADERREALRPFRRKGLICVWKYSKIYIKYVLKQFVIELYPYDDRMTTNLMYGVITLYDDLDNKFEYGSSELTCYDLRYINYNDNLDFISKTYKDVGLYIKYILTKFPALISSYVIELITA